jgi:hypothetical protein
MITDNIYTIIFLFIIVASFGLYFLPAIVAMCRRHRNTAAILILDLLLGWSFIGWVVALVWAFTNDVKPKESN